MIRQIRGSQWDDGLKEQRSRLQAGDALTVYWLFTGCLLAVNMLQSCREPVYLRLSVSLSVCLSLCIQTTLQSVLSAGVAQSPVDKHKPAASVPDCGAAGAQTLKYQQNSRVEMIDVLNVQVWTKGSFSKSTLNPPQIQPGNLMRTRTRFCCVKWKKFYFEMFHFAPFKPSDAFYHRASSLLLWKQTAHARSVGSEYAH